MSRYIALLRGINVGGRSVVPMAELRAMLTGLELDDPHTVLQSGNAVFDFSGNDDAAHLEKRLERATSERFGRSIDFMLRSAAQWTAIIKRNPFVEEARSDPSHTLVMALKSVPDVAAFKALRNGYDGPESLHLHGRELYLVYPEGIARSKLTHAKLEKALGCPGTARNWNTVLKLVALLD